MKVSEFRKLIREEISKILKEDDYFDYHDTHQGSGSQGRTQKGKAIPTKAVRPGMNVIITSVYNGGQGSGSQSFETNQGVVKSIEGSTLYLELDPKEISKYKTRMQPSIRKKGLPIEMYSIEKVTQI